MKHSKITFVNQLCDVYEYLKSLRKSVVVFFKVQVKYVDILSLLRKR